MYLKILEFQEIIIGRLQRIQQEIDDRIKKNISTYLKTNVY